jgi:hypothetical protein
MDDSRVRRGRAGVLCGSLIAALGLLGAPLAAQDVFGVLRGGVPPAPISGVVVTVTRLRDGLVVGRAVTGPSGSFRLVTGTDSVTVRALRIGQRPVVLFAGQLPAGAQRDIGRELPDAPASIATVRVRERARCGVPRRDGSVISALYADALTALEASLGRTDGEPPVVRAFEFEQQRNRRDSLLASSMPVLRVGATTQPYRSVPVPELLRDGFVRTDARGDVVYSAPDAIVLTDERYLAGTCLTLDRSRESAGRVGIAFAPERRTRNRVDVRGVLWLDAQSRTLERLDFRYVGLSSVSASVDPGGTVEYAQLPDGRWIIDRWMLRLPTLATEEVEVPGRAFAPLTRAAGVQVVRGVVTEVRQGDQLLYSVGGPFGERALLRTLHGALGVSTAAALTTRAPSSAAAAAAFGALRDANRCELVATPSTLALSVLVTDAQGRPRPGVPVVVEWRDRYVRGARNALAWELARVSATTNADGAVVLCGVPRRSAVPVRSVEVRAVAAGCAPARLPLRLSEGAALSEVELRLSPACGG